MTHRIGPAVRDAHRQHVADVAHDLEAGDTVILNPKASDSATVHRRRTVGTMIAVAHHFARRGITIDPEWCMP